MKVPIDLHMEVFFKYLFKFSRRKKTTWGWINDEKWIKNIGWTTPSSFNYGQIATELKMIC